MLFFLHLLVILVEIDLVKGVASVGIGVVRFLSFLRRITRFGVVSDETLELLRFLRVVGAHFNRECAALLLLSWVFFDCRVKFRFYFRVELVRPF